MSNDPRVTRGRKTGRPIPPPGSAAYVIRVHPGIWKTALKLAEGNVSRIKVISATKVEVR